MPAEELDDFFAIWLPSLEVLIEQDASAEGAWWPRLSEYFNLRCDFRNEFLPRRYRRATREELKRFKAVFDVWAMCVSDEGWDSQLGHLYRSYQLDLAARLAPSWSEQESLFEESAQACLNGVSKPGRLHQSLKRRALVLQSNALRIRAFSLLNSNPANLAPVQTMFREAYSRALEAQEVQSIEWDTHPSYLGFWAEAIQLRGAEVEGDILSAREAHRQARTHLSTFGEPDSLFREPNLWWSVSDFDREPLILDALEALKNGPSGLCRAVEALDKWLDESKAELAGTPRFMRMEFRQRLLSLLSEVRSGVEPSAKMPGLFEELNRSPALGRHTREMARQVELAVRQPERLSEVVAATARLFPLDTQGPPRAQDKYIPWNLVPHWYKTTYDRYTVNGESPAGALVLVWYARTVADFLWGVYLKKLAEQGGPCPPPRPDFLISTLPQVHKALAGLAKAMCWKGPPGEALGKLVSYIGDAVSASPANIASSILPAVLADTAYRLYPLPLRVLKWVDAASLHTTQFNGGERLLKLTGVHADGLIGDYIYIKPIHKLVQGELRQEGTLRLYPAPAFGKPCDALMLSEGPTDQAVMETVLDHLDPLWRVLGIHILPCEGDTMASRFDAFKNRRPVVLADADKSSPHAGKQWKKLWEMCCYGILLEPDLERLDLQALAQALKEYWQIDVKPEDINQLNKQTASGRRFEESVLRKYQQVSFKTRTFGEILGRQYTVSRIPAKIHDAALLLLRLANGRCPPCRTDAPIGYHHCAPLSV